MLHDPVTVDVRSARCSGERDQPLSVYPVPRTGGPILFELLSGAGHDHALVFASDEAPRDCLAGSAETPPLSSA